MTFEERHKALMEFTGPDTDEIDAAHLIGFIIAAGELQSDLLKEVKRLREEVRLTKEWLDQLYDEDLVSAFRFHVYGDD